MNSPFAEMRRLYDRDPSARGLVVDAEGVMLGPNYVLVARTNGSYRRLNAAALDRLLKVTFGNDHTLRRFSHVLDRITDALAVGDVVKAQLLGLEIPLRALDDEQLIRLQTASSLIKAGFDPDQPRDERGQWTAEGGGDVRGDIEPVAGRTGHTPAEKEHFVEAHLADAQKIADELGVPVENILALSALESNWGDSSFASKGNNFFGIHCPARIALDCVPARENPKVKVATFASYANSARSFAAANRDTIEGKSDPREFAAALQNSGKFGIDPKDGSKVPAYVDGVAATIRSAEIKLAKKRAPR